MYRFLTLVSLFILAFVGCQTDNTADSSDGDIIVANGKTILKVTMPETRTYLGEKQGDTYPMYWESDDQLCVNNTLSSKITINPHNPSSAEFEFDSELQSPYYISYYDYGKVWQGNSSITIFSNEQEETLENSFQPKSAPMYGIVKSANEGIKLHHLAGVLRFSVKSSDNVTTLKSITVRSESGAPLAGLFYINPILIDMFGEENLDGVTLSNGNLTAYDTISGATNHNYNQILYNCNTSKPLSTSKERTFFVTIPEGSHGLCYIEFATTDGKKMLCAWSANSIKGGIVKEFSTITFKEGGLDDVVTLKELESEDAGEQLEVNNIFGYVKDINGNPIEGVAVSDGFAVIETDSKGYFAMEPSKDAAHIFISVPAEYEIPVDKLGHPSFYQKFPGKQQYDFTLTPLAEGKEKRFALFAMADPQVWESDGFKRFNYEAVPGIAAHCAEVTETTPCYGITLGDIISTNFSKTGDASSYREPMRKLFAKSVIGMPVFQVMGNHDANYAYHGGGIDPTPDRYSSTWQLKMQRDHEAVFGPANYSFNRGDAHIVGMRNIEYYLSSSNEYTSRIGFSAAQIEWLRQDLEIIPKDKLVILCAHIQFIDKDSESAKRVLELLAQFDNAHIITGHTHINHNYEHIVNGKRIYEHNVSAICGSWWDANITMDGTPVGYQVFTCKNNNFADWYYIGFTKGMNTRSHQMRLYRGDAVTGGKKSGTDTYGVKGYYKFSYDSDVLLANVYNADSSWSIEVYENGVYSGDMTLIPNKTRPYHDNNPSTTSANISGNGTIATPYYSTILDISSDMHFAGLYLGVLGKKDGNYNTKTPCYHMYKYKLKNPSAQIMVKATDRFGNIYTETKITEGTDYSITGL